MEGLETRGHFLRLQSKVKHLVPVPQDAGSERFRVLEFRYQMYQKNG